MRACEGCRRRKIKCDAATTNAWPCAACVRLKLHCVPPTVNYNRSQVGGSSVSGLERVLDFDNSSGGSGDEEFPQPTGVQNMYQMASGPDLISASQAPSYHGGFATYNQPPYPEKIENQQALGYDNIPAMQMPATGLSFHRQASFQVPSIHPIQVADSGDPWVGDQVSAANLHEVLGELKIDETGIGERWHTLDFVWWIWLITKSPIHFPTENHPSWRSRL